MEETEQKIVNPACVFDCLNSLISGFKIIITLEVKPNESNTQ